MSLPILLLLYFNTCESCEILRHFIGGIEEFYGPMLSSVIFNNKIDDDGFELGLCTRASCLGYSDNDINETVNVLQESLSQNEHGWSLIFSGRNNHRLLRRLSGNFFAQQSVVFVPLDESESIVNKLRLDNNVVFYSADMRLDQVNLHEMYSINKGHVIEKHLGYWNHKEGLKIIQVNIWERRSDLQGIQLKNLVKRLPFCFTSLQYF